MLALHNKDTRVLIVDDSKFFRDRFRTLLLQAGFSVVGEATNGTEAVQLTAKLKPQLITMDLDMPHKDGLQAISEIMATTPTRILVVTEWTEFRGQDSSMESLARGALELLPKSMASKQIPGEKNQLVYAVERLANIPVVHHVRNLNQTRPTSPPTKSSKPISRNTVPLDMIAIGASTGGPRVLKNLFATLPANFPIPIVVVQHLNAAFASSFVEWLSKETNMKVQEASQGAKPKPGVILVCARPPHLEIGARGALLESNVPVLAGSSPSVDTMFSSVAQRFGAKGAGVLLTGMGSDGALGLKAISDAGGQTLVQDEATSVVFGMPKAALDLGAAKTIVPTDDLPKWFCGWARKASSPNP